MIYGIGMKVLTTILALIWFLGWGFWFLYERNHIHISSNEAKSNQNIEQKEDTMAVERSLPEKPSFLLNHPPKDSIDVIIDSLMRTRQAGETIQVISYYAEEEPYSGTNGNLGIQRSINLLQNASKRYASRVLQPIGLKLKEITDTTGISEFYQVDKINKRVPIRNLNDRRVLVFFPYASDNEKDSAKITSVIDSLTTVWNKGKNHLIITGYTDNSADETINYNLGLERAKAIQDRIVANGFPEEKITTLSRGEEDPISVNTTYDGRYLNRRVEILVDK